MPNTSNTLSHPNQIHPGKTALSVNVNKVALLRNTRHLGIPDVVRAARLCLEAGAQGITVHPRPDERHIRSDDVYEIAAMMKDWPDREFNIEGNPFQNLMHFVRDLTARWSFPADADRLVPLIDAAHHRGVRVSLFMDPLPATMVAAKAVGADRVEFYTETYARAWGTAQAAVALSHFTQAALAAHAAGLGVNAGHDLNRDNLTEFLKAVPGVREVSIGHALVADALELGYAATVRDYLRCIDAASISE
jgi:pyridoxine 5-phosphate synthase